MLEVNQVHFRYQDTPVLNGIDLEVGEGELVGLVGANGSGKTTLIRLLSGVLRGSSGKISIDGIDLSGLSSSERARFVSVVPQNPSLPLGFSVLDVVLMGRTPHIRIDQWEGRYDIEIAERSMEQTSVDRLANRNISTLSGGERQRVVVAMALAQETPVMLLDEPTSSLDIAYQTRIMDLIVGLHEQRGGVVLIAMHDLTLAARYCTRIVMISKGKIHADGSPREVLTKENIAQVYGVDVFVLPHPQGGTPVVVVV